MRSYAYYSMLSLTGVYGYNHYDLSDTSSSELYQMPVEVITTPAVSAPRSKKGIIRILMSLISFNRL